MQYFPQDSSAAAEAQRWTIASFIAFAIFSIICGIAITSYFFSSYKRHPVAFHTSEAFLRGTCNTSACNCFSDLLSQTVNHSVDPCVDFYKYACSRLATGEDNLRSRLAKQQVLNHIGTKDAVKLPATSALAKTALLYNTCIKDTTKADIEVVRTFLASYNLSPGDSERPEVDPLKTMLTMASKMQDGILFHLGLDYGRFLSPAERADSSTTHPFWFGLNKEFKRWTTWIWKNKTVSLRDEVMHTLRLIWPQNFLSDKVLDPTVHAIEAVDAEVEVMLRRSFVRVNSSNKVTIAVEDVRNYSKYLDGDLLVHYLSTDGLLYKTRLLLTVDGIGTLSFLDSLLTIEKKNLLAYLSWELARQLINFGLERDVEKQRLVCYNKVERLLGAGALVAHGIFGDVTDVTRETARDIFKLVRDNSVSLIRTLAGRKEREIQHLRGIAERLGKTQITFVHPLGLNNLEELDKHLSYVSLTNESFVANFLSISETMWRRTKQHGIPDWLEGMKIDEKTSYILGKEFKVPARYVLPPLFSLDGYRAANMGTFGWLVSEQIWYTLFSEDVGGLENPTSSYMADVFSKKTRCLKRRGGSLDIWHVFRAVAMSVLVETFEGTLKTGDDVSKEMSMQLLFLSTCLPECGVETLGMGDAAQRCNIAVMNMHAFANAFHCSDTKPRYEAFCNF
ncbi:uncharacterized protein LOC135400340 [Ornithodoros turicata]|uniref:uncharacterized protein LOC135400340 n=1 Tax=Ornithodoros turicata TaxID=34597 RepID=UPI003139E11F